MISDERVERLCQVLHDAYEDAAAVEGWHTQSASNVPWADVPDANKRTMRRAIRVLIDHLGAEDSATTGASRPVWRVGRKLGRTLYVGEGVVGMVDSSAIATAIVDAMNGSRELWAEVERLRDVARRACEAKEGE